MEETEMLEQTSETENVDTQATEEFGEGIELTDTSEGVQEDKETMETDGKEEVKHTLKELLESNPEYQEELNSMMKGRLDRQERKFQKELSKYKSTEEVLKAGLGAENIDDAEDKLREFWTNEGIKLPDKVQPGLSSDELRVLGERDADTFIDEGTSSMEEEANRLARIGYQNLNEREKATFNKLAETLTKEKDKKSLLKLGASEEILSDHGFNDFRKMFTNNTPIEKIYDMYMKNTKTKTAKENPGSMKNNDVSIVKDYYTAEEISKLTDEQLDNPKVWEAVRKSMTKNGTTNYYE